jgi:hypothetical protein
MPDELWKVAMVNDLGETLSMSGEPLREGLAHFASTIVQQIELLDERQRIGTQGARTATANGR